MADNTNIRSARDFIAKFYDTAAISAPRNSNYTIGTTAIPIGTAAFQRLAFVLCNTGDVNIAISFDPAVTITTGQLLLAGRHLSIKLVLRS